MSITPREFDHDGAVITDAAGGAFPWIRTASGMWFRQGVDQPLTWDELLAWHQDAVDDPTDDTTKMPTFVLLVPQPAAAASALREVSQAYRSARDSGFLFLNDDSRRVPWEIVARDLDERAARVAAKAPAPEAAEGLFGKYRVQKISDPDARHARCRYFVLDPEHDPRAVVALRSYADAVRGRLPTLAADIDAWVGQASATEDEAAESFAAELITMSVLGPDKDCDGDHGDGCCELDADRLPDGHMRLTFLVTDGTRPGFGQYRVTREVTR